jgi:hypothetical protein
MTLELNVQSWPEGGKRLDQNTIKMIEADGEEMLQRMTTSNSLRNDD